MSYDPCYHQACDSMDPIADGADADLYEALNAAYGGELEYNGVITNVNTLALEEMADAAAHAILTFAMSTGSVSGTAKASPVADGEGRRPPGRALHALIGLHRSALPLPREGRSLLQPPVTALPVRAGCCRGIRLDRVVGPWAATPISSEPRASLASSPPS